MSTADIDPTKTALLLMDFQNGIVSRVEEPAPLLERAAAAQSAARAAGLQVVYVRVAFTPQDRGSVPSTNKGFSASAQSGAMANDSDDTQVHDALRPIDGEVIVTKTRVGAFSTTNLQTHLHGRGIDTLVLAGIATSGVVLSTVRDAADRDYRLVVLRDACADMNPNVHEVLTQDVFPRQADVIDVTEFEKLLANG
jgi:nicotinamidase-related amidase